MTGTPTQSTDHRPQLYHDECYTRSIALGHICPIRRDHRCVGAPQTIYYGPATGEISPISPAHLCTSQHTSPLSITPQQPIYTTTVSTSQHPLHKHYNTPVIGWPQFEAHPSITVTPRTLHRDPSLTIRTKTRCQTPVSTTQTSNQTTTCPPSWSRRKPRYRQ